LGSNLSSTAKEEKKKQNQREELLLSSYSEAEAGGLLEPKNLGPAQATE
jgi:hypothetical protein